MDIGAKAARIMERYLKDYVTDSQLERYLALGAISQEEHDYIYGAKHQTAKNDAAE